MNEEIKKQSMIYDWEALDYTIGYLNKSLTKKYDKDEDFSALIVLPKYKKDYLWTKAKQSKFIESIVIGTPLNPIHLFHNDDGSLGVIDGGQRLLALKAFFSNELTLTRLNILSCLNKQTFSKLEPVVQRKISNRSFRVNVIKTNDKAILRDIGKRLSL